MEELHAKHRQQQKDLQSRITQKKKQATKKTRKGVNDECALLERDLEERQAKESACLIPSPYEDEPDHILGENTRDLTELNSFSHVPAPDESKPQLLTSSAATANGHAKKPNRQKARLARRAADQEAAIEKAEEEAANLPNLREEERESMRKAYTSKGFEEYDIKSDGHCLYAAIADQLTSVGIGLRPKLQLDVLNTNQNSRSDYLVTRHVAATYISKHPDDFSPFLEEPLSEYVKTIRETGEWGGHLEILALAKAYGVDINILQGDGKVERIESGDTTNRRPLWLAYYRHSYGLGEHYNSLRHVP